MDNEFVKAYIAGLYPYQEQYGIMREMPEEGLSRGEVRRQLQEMAATEDANWEQGRCSGTMYHGDHKHYDFLNECFSYFSHYNTLQRDMCPSMNKLESEIIAMTLEMLHGDTVTATKPGGVVGFGGTESILMAMLSYREAARERGVDRPQIIWPDTAHPAFTKAAHLFDMELITAPTDPVTTQVEVDFVRDHVTGDTAVIVASAGNYPYGTIDPISELSEIALEQGVGLHIDGCLGGWILPWGQDLGYPNIPEFDFRCPGVTSISADTHKYGYGLKGTSVLLWRDGTMRHRHYYTNPQWKGGLYASPGIAGSRSGGLVAATWAALATLGKQGYRERAKRIFDTSFALQDVVRSHPELRLMGKPTFLFSFTSDEFNIYHVNDALVQRGWRLNGQQLPDAIHVGVTGPQIQPNVVEMFSDDLAAAVEYAKNPAGPHPKSAGVYGGGPGVPVPDLQTVNALYFMVMDAWCDGPL
jgi:sphinganine-1-phosphate aldolase